MPKHKLIFLFFLSFSMVVLLSGCWDRVEIEDRGFAVGSAIDLVEKKANGNYKLMFTGQFVVPSGLGAPTQGRGSGGQKAYMNISATGESIFEINRELATLTSQVPFYQHLKVLVISKDIVKEPKLFGDILDIFIRDHEMRRGIRLVIVEGEAKKALDIKPDNENIPALYIDALMENNYKNAGSLKPVHIGDVQELLLSKLSYVLPEIHIANKMLQYKGAAVFDGSTNQLIDSLSEPETKGYGFLTEDSSEGALEIKAGGETATVELTQVNRDMKVNPKAKDDIDVNIDINIEANLAERFGKRSVFNASYIKEIEEGLSTKVEELAKGTKDKMQDDLKLDAIGIGHTLHQRHYDFWNTVKDDWESGENYFSQANINISAKAKIHIIGSSDKVKTTGVE
ncbi:Ger(x)C family spore germination protein [Virgibacillus salexigens]|uniref:Germination protein GerLC n=1 Tax=Virgibacillus kapii TaxID=1638645 RepID=A0ABQ2DN83_9BACI|nr:Ger(x)C family spore germination protein [Virgibacillus kapii]GGJ64264.1 germination protein GerLC [Virgibacillus kapii]